MQETGNSCTGFSKTVQEKEISAQTLIIGSMKLFQKQFLTRNNFYYPYSKSYNFGKKNLVLNKDFVHKEKWTRNTRVFPR